MATFDGQVRGSRGLCKTDPACSCIWHACTTPSATVEGKLDVSRRCPVLEWSGRVPARRVMLGLGRVSNGAPPCPANQSRPLPRWASRSARIRSMSSVSIDAVRWCPRQLWSRGQLEAPLAAMPPCLIGTKALSANISRKLRALGHDVRLMRGKCALRKRTRAIRSNTVVRARIAGDGSLVWRWHQSKALCSACSPLGIRATRLCQHPLGCALPAA